MGRVSVRSHPTLQTKLASYQCQEFVSLSWFLNPADKLTDGKLGLEDPEDCCEEPTASLLHRTGKECYQRGANKLVATFYTKNHFYSSQHFHSIYIQGRQLSTSSYEFIKTDLAGTENRWSRDTSIVSQCVKCHPLQGGCRNSQPSQSLERAMCGAHG